MNGMYPGSFDPITKGHIDVIERSSKLVDKLYVVIFVNEAKHYTFDVLERMFMIEESVKHLDNVIVDVSNDLMVDYASKHDIKVVFRGVRNTTDFEYELTMAHVNKKISEQCETLFIPTRESLSSTSSSVVRELSKYKHDIRDYVSPVVEFLLKKKDGSIKVIEINGPSGSGKSTIGRFIAENYNAHYIDLDKINHDLLINNNEVKKAISDNFDVMTNGEVDRRALANIVFNDKDKLELLESIVFPYISDAALEEIYANIDCKYIILDGVAINKTKLSVLVDKKIKVETEKNTQIDRIMKRDNITKKEAVERLKNSKENEGDYTIWNNCNLETMNDKIKILMGMIEEGV